MFLRSKLNLFICIFMIVLMVVITYSILKTYSLDEYSFTSSIYTIEDGYIENISQQTEVDIFYQYFDVDNCDILLVDENSNLITSGFVYTGSMTEVYNQDRQLIATYVNIVKGDMNQDGIVNMNDIMNVSSNVIHGIEFESYFILAMDMNHDDSIKANDIALLNSYLDKSYESLTLNVENVTLMSNESIRIIPTLSPGIILNQNLIWTSSDEDVAVVNDAGLVIGQNEGIAVITAMTADGMLQEKVNVVVDNTITLSSSSGKLYLGGDDIRVWIHAIDYEEITCSSSDETVVNCSIDGQYLVLTLADTAVSYTVVPVTVTSSRYGTATYTVTVLVTSLSLYPSSGCIAVNSLGGGTISSFNAGTYSLSVSDTDIIKEAYVNGKYFFIRAGSMAGDASVVVVEDHGYVSATFQAIVYQLSVNKIGDVGKVGGENIEATITGENTGDFTCVSEKEDVAECAIEGNKLIVTPLSKGQSNITIIEDRCGATTTFLAVVEEE